MKLNETTFVDVDKLIIRNNIMMLGVQVKAVSTGEHQDTTEYKLAVRFDNGKEARIVPLPVTAISADENGDHVAYAYFEYELDMIFKNQDLNDFVVGVQIYDGAAYKDVLVENAGFSQLKDENEYKCVVENQKIIIRRKKPVHFPKDNILLSLFCGIYRIFEFLLGTLLIPLFLLDGIYVVVWGNYRRREEITNGGSQFKRTIMFAKRRYSAFCRWNIDIATLKRLVLSVVSSFLAIFFRKNGVLFVSSRREDLTGNIAYVNDVLKEKGTKVRFWLVAGKTKSIKWKHILSLAYNIARSRVVVVDDFTPILNDVWQLKHCKYIQLWHACGAFKTFGFSRLGKSGGPFMTSRNHRNYDYAIVSSSEIRRFYAEGFGIDENNVMPLGVPRTDDFFDEERRLKIREKIYSEYPVLKDKKVILFAPTFRGNGANTADYPFRMFNVERLLNKLSDEYVIIIKHHPFVTAKHPCPKDNERVLDLSTGSEINDLLFVTDLLITDYSSVIFEASLLDIPMLFYAFDLEDYIVNRDFYYPFKNFVPGKIVRNMEQIEMAIAEGDYEQDKVQKFKHRFFDDLDGKSSERVADFIISLL